MNLIKAALRKPITILVIVAGLFFFGINAIRSIKIDIFPLIDLPVIYLSHPYGGFTPDQMEAYFGKNYVNLLLYVSGVKSIETKNIQSLTLIKLSFYEGTNMAQAAAEVSAFSNRAQTIFPPGTSPPFIIRFDASTLPVGQLILSSNKRSNNELQDLANLYVRSGFSSIPGLVAPAPFGGNSRTVVIKANPAALRAHNLTPDQLVTALRINNQSSPAGNVRIGDKIYFTPANTTIKTVKDFENIPLFSGGVDNLYLKDVATIEDGADVTTGYVLVNGRRSVYLPITKSAAASTWEVVQSLKAALPRFQALLPEDVQLNYEFDQSVYVINSVKSLVTEGAIGAVLTALMVLLFLKDPRGALIVIITIPICIISGILFLSLFHQTINIMTLSGLALAIGILVDESTVTIENIHRHMDMGKPNALAIWEACKEIAFSKLLILFCILAVFAPAFTMTGIPGSLFLPLSLAIGFSMITSYLMSQTLVPVLANWLMKPKTVHSNKRSGFDKFRDSFIRFISRMMPYRRLIVGLYIIGALIIAVLFLDIIGKDVLPKSNAGQFQVRIRDVDGTRVEKTERDVLSALNILYGITGKENISISSAMVGVHGSQFSTNPIYLFMAGPQEAVLQVALKEDYKVNMDDLKDKFREKMKEAMPNVKLSFEPIELTDKILSQGSPTPVEIKITGKNKKQNEVYAYKAIEKLKQIPYLRDVQLGQAIHYPAIRIDIDRVRAAQLGTNLSDISRSLTAATSSSRFTERNVWIDLKIANSYNVQVQVPENEMTSIEDIKDIPVNPNSARPVIGDVATLTVDTVYGENDNSGAIPMLTVTANLYKKDLGSAVKDVDTAIAAIGKLPRGLNMEIRGLVPVLTETLSSLQSGLFVAVIVIFLMLAANFQSFKVSLVVLCTVPAVLMGSLAMLLMTGSTLNLQSYMGIIMSVGVSISNSVLLVTNAEEHRLKNADSLASAIEAASVRMRPILMTSLAMVVGMIPMASGIFEGGDQAAPLGRAVIGGLVFSTFATLIILPLAFAWVQKKTSIVSVSLDPEDKESKFYMPAKEFTILAVVFMMSVFSSCSSGKDKEKHEERITPTEVVIAEKGHLSSTLNIPGELIAYQQVDLYAKVTSFVKKMQVDVGSQVKTGQLLAVLEAPEINSQLAGAASRLQSLEAVYAASKSNYNRLVETSKTPGTISPNDLDMAVSKTKSDSAQLQSAKAAYNEVGQNKRYLEIRAPFNGVITARNVSSGAYVGPTGKGSELPLFTLQEQRHLRLTVSIPELYTGYLTNKSEVNFSVRSLPGQQFKAKVNRMAGALDARFRSEKVEMDVYNDNQILLPGMVADIMIPLSGKDSAFIIPTSSLVNSTERLVVIRVKNGVANWINVSKGRDTDGKVEVYGDMKEGDTLVYKATEEVRDGSRIEKTTPAKPEE
jgi:RND family efflux transporter MFP subunit